MKLFHLLFLVPFYFGIAPVLLGQEGGPPMLTDDGRVADFKEWEINTSFNTSIYKDYTELSVPHVDLNYGLLSWLQLKVEVPLIIAIERNQDTKVMAGDIAAGIKMKFLDEEKHFVSAATFPQYFFNFNGDQGVLLPVFVEKTLGRFLIGEGFGYFFGKGQQNTIEFGSLIGYRPTETLNLMVEYFLLKHYDRYNPVAGTPGYVNLGFRWEVSDSFMFMGSFGTQVVTPSGNERERFISWLGIKNLF